MIWLVGSNGMLGQEIAQSFTEQQLSFVQTDLDVDITSIDEVQKFVAEKQIEWIVNAAAYTAVDKAESEETLALAVNGTGPGCIAKVASKINAKVVHISTDYVFDGEKEGVYTETDPVNPVSAYGRTKLAGEQAVQAETEQYFIFRISWLYGQYGANFVTTMLRLFHERDQLGVVADQIGAPTWTHILAANISSLISNNSNAYGIYHYADEGQISWYDFASAIYQEAKNVGMIDKHVQLNPIPASDYPTPAKRPANSCFDKTKVKGLGFDVLPWGDNLKDYLIQVLNSREEGKA